MRKFDIGHKVYCKDSGVVGIVLRFYTPTSCEEQTMVSTPKGNYHAPTSSWVSYLYGPTASSGIIDEACSKVDLASGPDRTGVSVINEQGISPLSVTINNFNNQIANTNIALTEEQIKALQSCVKTFKEFSDAMMKVMND